MTLLRLSVSEKRFCCITKECMFNVMDSCTLICATFPSYCIITYYTYVEKRRLYVTIVSRTEILSQASDQYFVVIFVYCFRKIN